MQILVKLLENTPLQCITVENNTFIADIKQMMVRRFDFLSGSNFELHCRGKLTNNQDALHLFQIDSFPICLDLYVQTLGGKGGFGANLKSQGARMGHKKTSNFDSCRDLSGRRIKTLNDAKRLADFIEQEPERRRAQQEKIQQKIKEGLKPVPVPKTRFDDKAYTENHEKVLEVLDDAIASGNLKLMSGLKKSGSAVTKKTAKSKAQTISTWFLVAN